MKKAGILAPVASLPSLHGIGDFGEQTYRFIDLIKGAGWNLWQILPLNPLGYGNSPYQPYSSVAGDEIYISLTELVKEGLLKQVPTFQPKAKRIDYEAVRAFKGRYLKIAFAEFLKRPHEKAYEDFIAQPWVRQYAIFLTLKKQNQLKCWNEWPKQQQMVIKESSFDLSSLQEEIEYEMFLQYKFFDQWMKLKAYANAAGIQIMGDLPFYVGMDSLDVWANQECFLLDADAKPSFVAGVPPDYFSKTGQRWGNPIYNWSYLKKDDFRFWIERLRSNTKLFDIIRIDHFRAFDTYWKIPASCDTAIEGEWVEAPGYELFDKLFAELPDIHIVAEDLGDLRPEVLQLRDHYGFPGMKVIQFSMNPTDLKTTNYDGIENMLLYTGTHDNQTIRGWYECQPEKSKRFIREKLKQAGCLTVPAARGLVEYTLRQNCCMAILPLQDILELTDEARINRPGTLGSPNWEWHLCSLAPLERAIRKYGRYYRY